jgi:hypothetical protein
LLIPALESYNPRFREVIWRTSRSLAGDHEIVARATDDAWKKCLVQENADFVAFDSSALAKLPLGLQRNLIRRAIERIHPDSLDIGFAAFERAGHFISTAAQHHARLDLAGDLHLLHEGLLIYVVAGDATLPVERWPQMPDESSTISLKIPGLIELSGGWKLNCERWNIASLATCGSMPKVFPMRWNSVYDKMATASNHWVWTVMP